MVVLRSGRWRGQRAGEFGRHRPAGARRIQGSRLPSSTGAQAPDYKALMLGALHYMQADEIDVLVVGLPVSEFTARKAALERLCVGEHDVGKGRKVRVHKALVVAQPQGALVAYAEEHGLLDQIGQQENLIIDCGTRTLDWLTARGLRLVANRSYSAQYGVHDVVSAICEAISREIGEHYDEPHIVDEALRTGRSITTYGKTREIQRYMPIAERIAAEGILALTNSIGGKYRFANIVLSGGGAHLFRKALRDAFKKQPVLELADPFYANVRGFQRAGVDRLRAQAPTDAGGCCVALAFVRLAVLDAFGFVMSCPPGLAVRAARRGNRGP